MGTGKGNAVGGYLKDIIFEDESESRQLDQEFEKTFPSYINGESTATPVVANDYSTGYANRGYYVTVTYLPTGKMVKFKGFLTEYTDNFVSSWKNESVYGRMDDIYTFQNTKRQINLGLVMPAFDENDARCNLAKCTILARKLYPYYSGDPQSSDVSTISRSPLLRLHFTNLIEASSGVGLLGKMNGFTFAPVIDDGFYDRHGGVLYPKTININFTYDVLHEHTLGWKDDEESGGLAWSDGAGDGFPYIYPTDTVIAGRTTAGVGHSVPPDAPTAEDGEADDLNALSSH